MNPRIQQVRPTDRYTLELVFTNGEEGIYDCSPLLDLGVFRELHKKSYFKQASVEYGTVVWPHEQDLCPDTLYEGSMKKVSANQRVEPTVNTPAVSVEVHRTEAQP